jgi:chorismate dehydratase
MIKVGCVDFINAYPLTKNLKGFNLIYDIPSQLAEKLHSDQLDIALISTIEYAKHSERYQILPNLCIASDKKVESITLFSNKKIEDIESVGYDRSTRSSIMLLKIILKDMGNRVAYNEVSSDLNMLLKEYDSVLLIGDNALSNRNYESNYKYDLGSLWYEMTDLPFVYAFWVCRKDIVFDSKEFKCRFIENSKDLSNLLSDEEMSDFNINYLENIIKYELSENRLLGLKTFFQKAFNYGFIDSNPEIQFYG